MTVSKQDLVPSTYDGGVVTDFKDGQFSRRNFLMLAGFGSISVLGGVKALGRLQSKTPIMVSSVGVLLHDPNLCVGCTRCELACTEFNDGIAQPSLARIHISRNYNLGPQGMGKGFGDGEAQGIWGNFKMIADTCKQCPHPVPCAEACPQGAIYADPTTKARVVDQNKCIGCGLCENACPWDMPILNTTTHKASKCFLCNGKPECAHACPTGALTYVPWLDLRQYGPILHSSMMPATTTTDCAKCHSA